MLTRLAAPAVVLLLVAGAVVHGAASHRWQDTSAAAGRFEPLHAKPIELGDYQSELVPNDMPLKEKSVATSRKYLSPERRQAVVVSVITGAPGSVATHTPDVCYPGSGYKVVRARTRETIDVPGVGPVSYYVAEFEKKTATTTDRQRVRWAWTTGTGVWSAPGSPRWEYLRVADLAKVYIVTAVPPGEPAQPAQADADSPAVREFVAAAFAQYAGRAAR